MRREETKSVGSGDGRRCGVFSHGRSLALGAVLSLLLIVGCRTNASDAGDGSSSSDDATDYGTDDGPAVCTDPMPGLCDEDTECGECGTCQAWMSIDRDESGQCSCRVDRTYCFQGTGLNSIEPYLMYHVEDRSVLLVWGQVAYENSSWAYCSDGDGPAECACDADAWALLESCI